MAELEWNGVPLVASKLRPTPSNALTFITAAHVFFVFITIRHRRSWWAAVEGCFHEWRFCSRFRGPAVLHLAIWDWKVCSLSRSGVRADSPRRENAGVGRTIQGEQEIRSLGSFF